LFYATFQKCKIFQNAAFDSYSYMKAKGYWPVSAILTKRYDVPYTRNLTNMSIIQQQKTAGVFGVETPVSFWDTMSKKPLPASTSTLTQMSQMIHV
jgi:hypothetical protein